MRILRNISHHTCDNKQQCISTYFDLFIDRVFISEYLLCCSFRQNHLMRSIKQIFHISFYNRYRKKIKERRVSFYYMILSKSLFIILDNGRTSSVPVSYTHLTLPTKRIV